ncbi:hypothetical protein AB0K00_20150 [Dactylosporangium sp. NPDC049525]|uniref:hypothetical protein n=1 Tax=Dactylosporangium sp. NPDC049525 TaxID=3154730 RepID=UPI003423E65A
MDPGVDDPDPRDATWALEHLRSPERHRADPLTQGLLVAGLQAISATLKTRHADRETPLLDVVWPSRDSIIACYNARRPAAEHVTYAVLAYRWRTMADFYADLFAWALHPAQYLGHRSIAQVSAPSVMTSGDLSSTAAAVAYEEITGILRGPVFRMKLLISLMDPVSPVFHGALERYYTAATDWWSTTYRAILAAAGLELRADMPLSAFSALMTAMAEGLALRFVARPQEFDHQLESVARTLAVGAMALIHGSTAEPGDGRSLAEYFQQRFAS